MGKEGRNRGREKSKHSWGVATAIQQLRLKLLTRAKIDDEDEARRLGLPRGISIWRRRRVRALDRDHTCDTKARTLP